MMWSYMYKNFTDYTHTEKLSELLDEFNKVAAYKIDTQKLVAYLYTTSKHSEKEFKKKKFHLK